MNCSGSLSLSQLWPWTTLLESRNVTRLLPENIRPKQRMGVTRDPLVFVGKNHQTRPNPPLPSCLGRFCWPFPRAFSNGTAFLNSSKLMRLSPAWIDQVVTLWSESQVVTTQNHVLAIKKQKCFWVFWWCFGITYPYGSGSKKKHIPKKHYWVKEKEGPKPAP